MTVDIPEAKQLSTRSHGTRVARTTIGKKNCGNNIYVKVSCADGDSIVLLVINYSALTNVSNLQLNLFITCIIIFIIMTLFCQIEYIELDGTEFALSF